MKNIKINIGVFLILLIFAILQADRLVTLRSYNQIDFNENDNRELNLNKMLFLLENKECNILNLKYSGEYWQGEVVFEGNLEDFIVYINKLKDNNIYVKSYRFEKVEELKCFLEIKAF
ncbi:hypothetical protein [Clostridium sp. B9]|uniref:hypothetical protein n=1 Tax=Clostridium sp. B9 TaxID=3423224 RepID=UPI003D2F305C